MPEEVRTGILRVFILMQPFARRRCAAILLLICSLTAGASARSPEEAPESARIHVARISPPPKIDGVMTPDEWDGAARTELLYQTQPGDNIPPSERTEVFLGIDNDNLYVAFRAYDRTPQAIRGRITRRDDVDDDDNVALFLDTFNARRRAYVFRFNALGIQADGIQNEGTNLNPVWDGILESRGSIDDQGYTVEVAIPFKTLRFDNSERGTWGLHMERWIARKAERVQWRPVSRDVASYFRQMGIVDGLNEIGTVHAVDLIPTVTASANSTRQADGLSTVLKAEPGLTATWSMTPGLTWSAAVNPDFSQIEADVPQIEVNQRFPLFYAEKRPFFLEGDEVFRSPGLLTFVNTRQIVDPDWGVKLTGKTGRNTLGLLSASDRAPGLRQADGQPGRGENATFQVARYQRDILRDSILGVFVTDQHFARSYNTVVAADGRLRFGKASNISFQASRSRSRDLHDHAKRGGAYRVSFEHAGRHWRALIEDAWLSPDYDSLVGFVRRAGIRPRTGQLSYEFRPAARSWFVSMRPNVSLRHQLTEEGLLDESYLDTGMEMRLARNILLSYRHSLRRDGVAGHRLPYAFDGLVYETETFKMVTLKGELDWGGGVFYDPKAPVVGRNLKANVEVQFRPGDRFRSEWLYLKSRLQDDFGRRLFNQDVIRNRTTYQFTRFQSARVIIEYNTLARRTGVSLLYSYSPRTNSALYVGYNDLLYNGYDPIEQQRAAGLFRASRTFFVKWSHDFRF